MKLEQATWSQRRYKGMSPPNTLIPRLQEGIYSKRFYIQGLHRKQRRFSHAVNHLVNSQVVCNVNNNPDDIVTEPACNKIDMSNIDFGNKRKATSSKLQE